MIKLGVNIDHTATLRQARGGTEPEPADAAAVCEFAGCDSIVAHLREDRRHINDRDIYLLKKVLQTHLNLEMSIADEIVGIALDVKPAQVTLVPEKREELTTEGGLDVCGQLERLKETVERFHSNKIIVSLFIDPEKPQIEAAKDTGANSIELHTGRYANVSEEKDVLKEFEDLKQAASFAKELGLRVNAGHGLNYKNTPLICTIPEIEELNIGHSIISRAVFVGLERAVREMLGVIGGKIIVA